MIRSEKRATRFPRKAKSLNPLIESLRVSAEVKGVLHAIQREVDESWREQVNFLVEKLELHGEHNDSCNVYYGTGRSPPCTCGLTKLLKRFRGSA